MGKGEEARRGGSPRQGDQREGRRAGPLLERAGIHEEPSLPGLDERQVGVPEEDHLRSEPASLLRQPRQSPLDTVGVAMADEKRHAGEAEEELPGKGAAVVAVAGDPDDAAGERRLERQGVVTEVAQVDDGIRSGNRLGGPERSRVVAVGIGDDDQVHDRGVYPEVPPGGKGEAMKKWLLVVAGVAGGLLLFVLVLVLAVSLLLRDEGSFGSGSAVGIVEVKGVILDSQETIRQLRECGKSDRVRAVVLRIDSPGGVVAPSQEIHEEVKKLAARKKVVVSMGSVAASGGYYIAVPATVIYANPATITGSIGVILKLANLQELMGKVGVRPVTLTTGRFKDTGSPSRPLTAEDRALLQGVIESSFGQFVRAVADGRRLPEERVRLLADGRILTGEQALALKLVDRLGNLQDAIDEAGRLGGIKGEPQQFRPKKERKLLDLLVAETAGQIGGLVRGQGFSLNYELDGFGETR